MAAFDVFDTRKIPNASAESSPEAIEAFASFGNAHIESLHNHFSTSDEFDLSDCLDEWASFRQLCLINKERSTFFSEGNH